MCAQSLQSGLPLCDPVDCSPPGSSVHGILQARILEWVATNSSRGSSRPKNRTWVSCISCITGGFLTLSHQGSPDLPLPTCKSLCMGMASNLLSHTAALQSNCSAHEWSNQLENQNEERAQDKGPDQVHVEKCGRGFLKGLAWNVRRSAAMEPPKRLILQLSSLYGLILPTRFSALGLWICPRMFVTLLLLSAFLFLTLIFRAQKVLRKWRCNLIFLVGKCPGPHSIFLSLVDG